MDVVPGFLAAPPAEVLEDVLREQFGPLPQLAAICRLKRLPSGGYSSTEDLQLVLERRRVANAKERERVSAGRRGSLRRPGSAAPRPRAGAGTASSPLSPHPLPSSAHLVGPQSTHSPPARGARGSRVSDSGLVTLRPGPAAHSPPLGWPPHVLTHLDLCRNRRGELRRPLTTSEMSPLGRCFFKA